MGDRATIAFCAADGTEWARIYISKRGDDGRAVLEKFFLAETVVIGDGIRDARWQQPGYLAARFVAWYSSSSIPGTDFGIVPADREEPWHWKVTSRDSAGHGLDGPPAAEWPIDWPLIEQLKPEPIDTTNDFALGINGYGVTAPALPVGPMDRAKALRTAAWLIVLADPGGEEFAAVLEAVRST